MKSTHFLARLPSHDPSICLRSSLEPTPLGAVLRLPLRCNGCDGPSSHLRPRDHWPAKSMTYLPVPTESNVTKLPPIRLGSLYNKVD